MEVSPVMQLLNSHNGVDILLETSRNISHMRALRQASLPESISATADSDAVDVFLRGSLLTWYLYPFISPHPVRWGVLVIVVSPPDVRLYKF